MILPIKLRLPVALGGLELVGEIELPDSISAPAPAPELTDESLCGRWSCSARTLKRLRDARQLPYFQVGKLYRYRLSDIEAFETQSRVAGPGAVAVRRRRALGVA